jgi:hypothetical protein
MKRPASCTLRTAEGEAIMARLSIYAPHRSDCERLMQVMRWYFGLVWIIAEAKMSLKTLRTLLCGRGPKPPERSPAAVTPAAPPLVWRQ